MDLVSTIYYHKLYELLITIVDLGEDDGDDEEVPPTQPSDLSSVFANSLSRVGTAVMSEDNVNNNNFKSNSNLSDISIPSNDTVLFLFFIFLFSFFLFAYSL